MGTDVDWQDELDSSFGTGQDLPPGHYIAAGRTAVRRRRAASFAIVASMVVGVGAATWATSPGPSATGRCAGRDQRPVTHDGCRDIRTARTTARRTVATSLRP